MLFRRGYSLNKISNSLRSKGIEMKNILSSIEKLKNDRSDPDFISAMKICKKRRIGPIRPEANREIFYKKDMGILARSGFSYDISKKILSMTQEEFNQLLKLT
tara:strand:+ start:3594 stop:3902 length:309 start_codon:yes stop_codon:yes gene_type:complete